MREREVDGFNVLEFERDFCLALNMTLGESYEQR
jgi:hypothetical protein